MELEVPEETSKVATLISMYGEFWDPDLINWNRSWQLLGKERDTPNAKDINVYEQRGVYVLYKDYVPVYVGKAFKQSIGYRLQLHRESRRKGPRWDSFSWFGVRSFTRGGELRKLKSRSGVSTDALIETLEALLIVVIDPRLNSRREKLKGAVHLFQSDTDKPVDLDQRLSEIEKSMKALVSQSKS